MGTLWRCRFWFRLMMPPSTTVWLSWTITVVPARRAVVRGAVWPGAIVTNDRSWLTTWSMSIRTWLPGEMCGGTFRVIATSWNSVEVCAIPVVMVVAPAYGMLSPIEISAGLLSVTITGGVEMILILSVDWSAWRVAWKFWLTML